MSKMNREHKMVKCKRSDLVSNLFERVDLFDDYQNCMLYLCCKKRELLHELNSSESAVIGSISLLLAMQLFSSTGIILATGIGEDENHHLPPA